MSNTGPQVRPVATGSLTDEVLARAGTIVLGKQHQIRLALACLLARGHLLIEDVPGVGKTILAQTLARVLGLEFKRIQFTSDLLPADIIGVSIYDPEARVFRFNPGPVFSPVVLADEINRATPKAQSALLEAMEERQVSADGQTYVLPQPFFVIATQNPRHQIGTFPLPESQLDRFLMRIDMGYPDRAAEREILMGRDRRAMLRELDPALDGSRVLQLQEMADGIRTSAALLDYVQELLVVTRHQGGFHGGLSPRAGLAVVRAARSWALLAGRDAVVPEDVQAVLPGVVGHRLAPVADETGPPLAQRIEELIRAVPVP